MLMLTTVFQVKQLESLMYVFGGLFTSKDDQEIINKIIFSKTLSITHV